MVIFYGKKISCLKMIFGPSWSFLDMNFFWPEKKLFDTFRWISPFSMIFLWSQSSGFAPSIQNLVRNWNFGGDTPARLPTLQKNGKNQKTVLPDSFFGLTAFNKANHCKLHSDQVSRHSIDKKCDFSPIFNFLPSPLKLNRGF